LWEEQGRGPDAAFHTARGIQSWGYLPFVARELLIAAILDIWYATDSTTATGTTQTRDFVTRLLEDFGSVNVYSLNYDPLVYESIKNVDALSLGFDAEGCFHRARFLNACSVVAFLHGHVGFTPQQNEVRFSSDYRTAQLHRMDNVFRHDRTRTEYQDQGMKGSNYNTYLVTGLDKVTGFARNPFASYVHRFAKDIISSDYIVLLGTSLSDEHLNSFLMNALYISDAKRIVFVTKGSAEHIPGLCDLWRIFRDWTTVDASPDPYQSYDAAQRRFWTSCQESGRGMLSDHILVYTKGTEGFYKEPDLEILWQSAASA
jgi:hypothetical protein